MSEVGQLMGCGFSVVPRQSLAALHQLHSIYCHEYDEREDRREARAARGMPPDPADKLSEDEDQPGDSVPRFWQPKVEWLSRQPAYISIPFKLTGTWNGATGDLEITKQHSKSQIVYTGSARFLCMTPAKELTGAPRIRLELASGSVAVAKLNFSLSDEEVERNEGNQQYSDSEVESLSQDSSAIRHPDNNDDESFQQLEEIEQLQELD
jgi:hypothetical protein